MSEELKPCPFCGSKEVYSQTFTKSLFGGRKIIKGRHTLRCFNYQIYKGEQYG